EAYFCTKILGPGLWETPPRNKPDDSPKDSHFTALDVDFVNWFRGDTKDYDDRPEGLVVPKTGKQPVKQAADGRITGADLWRLFSKDAHMYLYACSGATSDAVGGGRPDPTLVNLLADLFGCRVIGFNDLIKYTYSKARLSVSRPQFEFSLTLLTAGN